MTRETAKGRPMDDELAAYLDGELGADQRAWVANWLAQDGELRNRLLLLESGARSFREAFELLLPRRLVVGSPKVSGRTSDPTADR